MMRAAMTPRGLVPFGAAITIWIIPTPAGLTVQAWHLFAIFVAAIVSVLVGAYPLLTSTMLAVAAVVISGTIPAAKALAGFANSSVLLVVIALLVAQAVVKSGLGRRISLFMVSRFGRSSLGLAYSVVITDALIAPAFPSNTARGGVVPDRSLRGAGIGFAIGRRQRSPSRRLSDVLRNGKPRRLVGLVDDRDVGKNAIGIQIAKDLGVEIGFGKWLVAASVPALVAILALPWVVSWLFPPRVGKTPEAPKAARKELASLGACRATSGSRRLPSCSWSRAGSSQTGWDST